MNGGVEVPEIYSRVRYLSQDLPVEFEGKTT